MLMGKVAYDLQRDGELMHFSSEKEACEFLGVTKGAVSTAYCQGIKCNGWIPIKIGHQHCCSKDRLYQLWIGMKMRCYNPSNASYKNYGGRGIQVCDEWKDNYENFRLWAMSSGYNANAKRGQCTIERINLNDNYCPENCTWKTMKEQNNNKRSNRLITFNEETHNLSEWADILGIKYGTLLDRLNKLHWSIEDAFTRK
jgi:hypothetical protein